MRGARIAAAALVLAVLTACGGDDGGSADRRSTDSPDRPGADATDEGQTTGAADDVPTRPLQSAAVAVVGDEVWIVGGVAGYDPYEPNPLIIRRSAGGEILGTLPLDLADPSSGPAPTHPGGREDPGADEVLLAGAPPVVIGGTTYLQGSRCPLSPMAENGPCVHVEPMLHRVEPDGLVALAVPPSWGHGPHNTPGSFGFPPWAVGSVGDRIVTSAAVGDGPIPAATEQVEVALVDPATASATVVPTVPGVLTSESVCADGERLWSLAPALDADQRGHRRHRLGAG